MTRTFNIEQLVDDTWVVWATGLTSTQAQLQKHLATRYGRVVRIVEVTHDQD